MVMCMDKKKDCEVTIYFFTFCPKFRSNFFRFLFSIEQFFSPMLRPISALKFARWANVTGNLKSVVANTRKKFATATAVQNKTMTATATMPKVKGIDVLGFSLLLFPLKIAKLTKLLCFYRFQKCSVSDRMIES
jgi:hypothetical protein